jgi:hypothetical protein
MSTSPANPPGYGPPPSTLPKSPRFYRRPGVGKTTLVNSILRILAAKNASLS